MNDNLDLFARIDFLQKLDNKDLIRIAGLFEKVSFLKGTLIFKEDDLGDVFYIVSKGRIELTKRLKMTENITGVLSYFSPYEYFGELALLDDEPRSATAIATEDSELLKICKEDFLCVCKDYPEVMLTIVKTMSCRLRETNDRYIDMWDELIKKSKLAAIGTAASKIVHDIKNPITIIVLTAQLIERVFEGTSEFTEKIVDQVSKVNNMVKEILDFASGESTGFYLTDVDLESLFADLSEDMCPVLEVKNVELKIENSVKQSVKLDRMKINRVLVNLIRNSVEAFEGEAGKIDIHASIENSMLHISVRDNGPGIPDRFMDNIFEPFVTYNKKSGTGLGLAISKKIVDDHNGKINVSNISEGGAWFDIFLPLYK